jgi:hypothetical protein
VEPLVGLIAAAVAASVAYLVNAERRRAQLAAWRAAASRAGLSDVEEAAGGLFEGAFLAGRHDGFLVRLESYRRGKYEYGTKIVIDGLGHGTGGLTLRREGFSTAIEKRVVGEREVEIGDPAFDAEYYVQGHAPLALAILDPETRRRLAALLRGRIPVGGPQWVDVRASLSYGRLEVEVKEILRTASVPDPREGSEVARLVALKDVPACTPPTSATSPRPGAAAACWRSPASSRSTRPPARRSSPRGRTRARR